MTPKIVQKSNLDFMYNFNAFFFFSFVPLTVTLCMKKLEL